MPTFGNSWQPLQALAWGWRTVCDRTHAQRTAASRIYTYKYNIAHQAIVHEMHNATARHVMRRSDITAKRDVTILITRMC